MSFVIFVNLVIEKKRSYEECKTLESIKSILL